MKHAGDATVTADTVLGYARRADFARAAKLAATHPWLLAFFYPENVIVGSAFEQRGSRFRAMVVFMALAPLICAPALFGHPLSWWAAYPWELLIRSIACIKHCE